MQRNTQNSAKSVLCSSTTFLKVDFGGPKGLVKTAPSNGSGFSGCTTSGLTLPLAIRMIHLQNWGQFWTIHGIHQNIQGYFTYIQAKSENLLKSSQFVSLHLIWQIFPSFIPSLTYHAHSLTHWIHSPRNTLFIYV